MHGSKIWRLALDRWLCAAVDVVLHVPPLASMSSCAATHMRQYQHLEIRLGRVGLPSGVPELLTYVFIVITSSVLKNISYNVSLCHFNGQNERISRTCWAMPPLPMPAYGYECMYM